MDRPGGGPDRPPTIRTTIRRLSERLSGGCRDDYPAAIAAIVRTTIRQRAGQLRGAMYGLSDADLQIQATARSFADELIPLEVTAELNDGELPADVVAGHAKRARELGLHAANMPEELGGGGFTSLQQVLVQEQVGRVTNALAWVVGTPPSWLPAVATPYQLDRFVLPAIRGDAEECYAITEE